MGAKLAAAEADLYIGGSRPAQESREAARTRAPVHGSLTFRRGSCMVATSSRCGGERAARRGTLETQTMAGLARRPTVLIVLHQEHSTPGRVGRTLREMGARLDIRRPSLDEPLPKTLRGHDGAVIFGGPMGANDSHDWIKREIDWLEVPLAEKKPFLGICLGAQMLARALGARVFTYEDKRSEIGYFPISPTAAADRLCAEPVPALRLPVARRRLRPAGGRRTPRHRGRGFPQSGLSLRQSGRPPVPPGSDLSHDVPVDDPRRRAPDAPGRAEPARCISAAGISTTAWSPHG